ncbi:MAG TPA: bifunctional 4-hydroxy-2-oxoglutarate aldolase/2-dehydro-3-deoxy-phosphogluconate aldolase [Gemmatimonadaceae bacterium]|nr:bifunctional 4-hydroxy-2-oxoglutarate aldolase/2-dehydro-3-deoxy-phosphogluconate aldolase [Gemmatimonadaceae bacterium]
MTPIPVSPPAKDEIVDRLRQLRLVPVIVIDDPKAAPALGRALAAGGLPCAEVTFRTIGARASIERMVAECPDVLVGAGTVLTREQAMEAEKAGARFIVSPGFGPAVVDYCLERGIPVFPGVATPTEIELAMSRGLRILKFFPAEPLGGVKYLKAISAPYASVEFIPTGGVGLLNLAEYLRIPCVVACGGSWVASAERIAEGDFKEIENAVRGAVKAIDEMEKRSE